MLKRRYMLILIVISLVCAISFGFGNDTVVIANTEESMENYNEGRKYLQELENLNVDEIEKEIKDTQKMARMKEFMGENGTVDFKKYFKDTIFMGDSITEFISVAEILPESNVYAKKGKTVLGAEEDIKKLKYSKPERVIMLFGMNDVINFSSAYDFKDKYIKLINDIKEAVPDTKIYVESPTPIAVKAENKENGLNNERLDKFREVVKESAEETGVTYVDLTVITNTGDYLEQDGMHFKYNFYDVLFKYLKNTIEDTEKE
ncbi:GDSL-type esterase/lipase family protein [uncultured Clostridium sp.]|uniref:GDSL-type esterase/lipase family protein n=1 Tax=uncultured Clostridium sp. TaxID=59620 RepID=UPI0025E9D820|nr:GDSL-type esterase/lipase family protein [uncultured Clostridium sp.]